MLKSRLIQIRDLNDLFFSCFEFHTRIRSLLASGSRGFTRYWDGGLEMSRTTGNKSANSNLRFPMELTIVLKFRSVILSTSSPLGTFDLPLSTFDLRIDPVGNQKLIKIAFCNRHCLATCTWQESLVEDSKMRPILPD